MSSRLSGEGLAAEFSSMVKPRNSHIICIFGDSRVARDHPQYAEAELLGRGLVEQGFTICTGGYGGVMEAASRGARLAGGHVIGVTSQIFSSQPNEYLNEEIPTVSLFERLQKLSEIGNGFAAVRGGIGTLAEVSVIWNLIVIKALSPPPPFIFVGPGWRSVVRSWKKHLAVDERDLPYVEFAPSASKAPKHLARRLIGTGNHREVPKPIVGQTRP